MKNRLVLLLFFFTIFGQWSFAQGIDCAAAIEMTSYDDCRRRPGNTTIFSSNQLSSGCDGLNEDGGWFKFKAVTGRSQVSVSTDHLTDMAISVYRNCDVEIACATCRTY